MRISEIQNLVSKLFRLKWKALHGEQFADASLRYPGVYLLAYTAKQLGGTAIVEKDILYVGMSNAESGVKARLKQFRRGLETYGYHSGAMRFYREYQKNVPWSKLKKRKTFFYVALPIECTSEKAILTPSDLRALGHVSCLEYYAIARIREKTKRMPPLNKFGKRPVFVTD